MHRAGQRILIGNAFACVLFTSGTALAFHTGNTFDLQPGSGGGGGLFYTGSPRERGWTCAACHLGAPLRTRVNAGSDPPDLLAGRSYSPGQRYRLTFVLENEHAGIASTRSNYNTIAISSLTAQGLVTGSFSGYAAEDFYARGTSILASAGRTPNQTSWAFDWTAPAAGTGPVRFYIAVVDGNGANSDPNTTLTDPFGDDIAVGELAFSEGGTVVGGASAPGGRVVFGGEPPGRFEPRPVAPPHPPHPPLPQDWSDRMIAAAAALLVALGLAVSALFARRNPAARTLNGGDPATS